MAAANALLRTVEDATSQDPETLKHAEEQLKAWEEQPNFYQALLNICFSQDVSSQVRWFAALHFKNGVEKYWRRSRQNNCVISDDEKYQIRSQLISTFCEPVYQISVQLAVVIGRIARTDLRFWPELIPTLLEEVKSSEILVQHNSLLTLNQVIKGLMSKRLVSDRKIFKEVSSSLFAFLLDVFLHHSNQSFKHIAEKQFQQAESSIKITILNLKVLRKLLVEGYDSTNNGEAGEIQLLLMLVERIPSLLRTRIQLESIPVINEKVQKLITNSMKVLFETQDRHPLLFIHVLENALKVAINYVFNLSEKEFLFDSFVVQCCNLIRSIIRCKEYSRKKQNEIEDNVGKLTAEAQNMIRNIMSSEMVQESCRQLIFRYFPLKTHELEEWENDPESYLAEEAGDTDNSILRPCAESLFLAFYYQYRTEFNTVISEMLHPLVVSSENENEENLLKKEAVYFALGLASYELFGDLNFDKFFQESLVMELQNRSQRFKMTHRRVLWLVGKWINVSFSSESRVLLYQIISEMLNKSKDLVVRITAAQTLKDAVDEYQFKKEDFLPFLETIWDRLFRLLIDVNQSDTKMNVLNVISILIERVGHQIKRMTMALCEYLPHLWMDSSEYNMLRCLVLTTLSHVVKALGPDSMKLHQFLLPIIQFSTDLKQPAHVYLLDDSLELWLQVMQNSSSMPEELLIIFAVLPDLLEQVSENFRICMTIMKAYILLDPISVLRMYSNSLVKIVQSLIGQMKAEGNILIAELIGRVFVTLPTDGPVLFEIAMLDLFKIVISDEEYPQVIISYLTLFGYTILNNLAIFNQIVQKACQDHPEKTEEMAGKFLDIWLEKVDCMTNDETKKLTTMALMSILPLNANFVNERFALILDVAINSLYDSTKIVPESEDQSGDKKSVSSAQSDDDDEENMDSKRQKILRLANPVVTTSLLGFVKIKLSETKISLGIEKFNKMMETIDPVIGKQLISLIS